MDWDYVSSSSSDDDRKSGNAMFVTPPPKRAKAFELQLTPTPVKSVDLMGAVEQSRMAEHYVHPTKCCKKLQCWRHFDEEAMRKLRHRVWTDYGKDHRGKKTEIARIRDEVLKVDGRVCCITFLKTVFGVSNTYIYGDNRRKPKMRESKVIEAIISFFNKMRLENDRMPDRPEYQMYCRFKKDVWRWYQNQPSGYVKCSESFFYRQWKLVAPDCKLKKSLRFAKCNTCEDLRSVCSVLTLLVCSFPSHCSVRIINQLTFVAPNSIEEVCKWDIKGGQTEGGREIRQASGIRTPLPGSIGR